jgi:hypothetical protein
MANLSQSQAHIEAYFILDGKKYNIEKFKIVFNQSVDFKGQPEHETSGGQILITLSEIADDNLYLWAKKSTLQKNGQVLFQTDLGITVLKVNFINAYCINLERSGSALTGTKTTLFISPEIIIMDDVEHNNFWKNA